jgi:glycerol-3-phosphate acyltransferase PlsY
VKIIFVVGSNHGPAVKCFTIDFYKIGGENSGGKNTFRSSGSCLPLLSWLHPQ